ncbi:TPA: winged helix-turn-helix transcriptional regulator [Escherichia coli]|uniref:FaeA/PapI family transcriptional regulator n=1 Tax=Escherichia coli TaxID=562 RepID=UPI000BE6A41C|nr:winged helix-turn-helix transcriptional regulator [Escherichia coli]MBB8214415.1 winged helix-turn-helix transcriptional regulator [Escherichia coli]HAW0887782.1 winged helix-turn-helix transcriptional regulator [Escherichia coli]HCX7686540.1 winged helix-turn-helix transcriptional regulator [Escherichia coli]
MTVYRNNKSNDISHQIIQYLLRKNESCCTAAIARALHLSVYQARYYLQQLEKKKKFAAHRCPGAQQQSGRQRKNKRCS